MKTISINLLRKVWTIISIALIMSLTAKATVIQVTPVLDDSNLIKVLIDTASLKSGDTVMLAEGTYVEPQALRIFKTITVMGDPSASSKPIVNIQSSGFNMNKEYISLTVKGIEFSGLKSDGVSVIDNFFVVQANNVDTFNILRFQDLVIRDINRTFHMAAKGTFTCDSLIVDNITMYDKLGTDFIFKFGDKAYPKYFGLTNSTFYNIQGGIFDNPRNKQTSVPAYTPKMDFLIDHNTFYRVVSAHRSFLQTEKMNIYQTTTNGDSLTITISNNIIDQLYSCDTTVYGPTTPFKNWVFPGDTICSTVNIFCINNSVSNFDNVDYPNASQSHFSNFIKSPNVTASDNLTKYPEFADTSLLDGDGYDFSYKLNSSLATASTTGGPIGDPDWAPEMPPFVIGEGIHQICNDVDDVLEAFLEDTSKWNAGDTIMLTCSGVYSITGSSLEIKQSVTLMGSPLLDTVPIINFQNNGLLITNDSMNVLIKGINFNGYHLVDSARTPYIIQYGKNADCINNQNIIVTDCEAWGFQGGIKLNELQHMFYDTIIVDNVIWHDFNGSANVIEPSMNHTRYVSVTNSTFYDIGYGFIANPCYMGYKSQDTVLVPKKFIIDHNTFYNVVGLGNKSLIQINDPKDTMVTFNFTNNIVSKLYDSTLARPFRINSAAGYFTIAYNTFHRYYSTYQAGIHNLDTIVAKLDNVDTMAIYRGDPNYADPLNGDFTIPDSSDLYFASTTGGAIGDPRWAPLSTIKVVSIAAITSKVVVGYDKQLEVVVELEGSVDKTVTWSVEDNYGGTTGTATIDPATGLLSPTAVGQVKVKAVSNYNTAFFDTLIVNIQAPTLVTGISLSAKNSQDVSSTSITNKGGYLTVTASVTPVDADNKSLTWSVSGTGGVTVIIKSSTTIEIVATKSGNVTVTATSNDGSNVSGSLDVTITGQAPVTDVTVSSEGDATEISVKGGTLQMIATVSPDTADIKTVTWSVNNTAIATISAEGLLTAVSDGVVTVTARATDGTYKSGTMDITISNQTIGMNSLLTDQVKVLPNPATSYIRIESAERSIIALYDILGSLVMIQNVEINETVNIQNLAAGIYFVQVRIGEDVKTVKLIKK